MDDQPGQTPADPDAYASQQAYAPAPPVKKKRTPLIVLGIVGALLACCVIAAVAGVWVFNAAPKPAASIDAINEAALTGDAGAYEKYFDVDSVVRTAYPAFLEYMKTTPDYAEIVEQVGEEEADRLLREDALPEEAFVENFSAEIDIDQLEEGQVPFPQHKVTSTRVTDDTAELTVVTIEDGEEVTYILAMALETWGDEEVWRLKEIRNIGDILGGVADDL